MQTSKQLKFLAYFERLKDCGIDFETKYHLVVLAYGRELEMVRSLYERDKEDPPIERNITPVVGKIRWSRHLLKRIQEPIEELEARYPQTLKVNIYLLISDFNARCFTSWCVYIYAMFSIA